LTGARPRTLVLVLGTGTEVGKTWVAARLLERWRADGLRVAARKPAQSFEPGDDEAGVTDAQVLGAASGEDPHNVCPDARWYPVPMAPPIAASVLGRPAFTLADLVAELDWPAAVDIGVIETAGGIRSPQADDGDGVALLDAAAPDIALVVADAGLGTINAVTLNVAALATASPHRRVIFLNRFDADDELHVRNRAWLEDRLHLDIVTDLRALADTMAGPNTG
jgi:dethiobiotin synthetase